MKKILCIILAALTVLPLVACSTDGGKTSTDPTNVGPVRTIDDDGLPELNFNNETVVFLTEATGNEINSHASDLYRDSINNDVLNDVIYNRTKKVEERLGIKLKFQIETTRAAHAVCNDSVLTGLDEYQLLGGQAAHTYSSVHGGYYLNLLDKKNSKYLDLEREWWNPYMVENATVYGNCSVITGALSLSYVRSSFATLIGKAFAEDHNIDIDFYQLVRDGKWTVEKQLEIIKGLYSDVTGDGKSMDDMYGFIIDDTGSLDGYWGAFEMSLLKRTDDGGFEIDNDHKRITDAVTKVYEMMYENQDIYTVRILDLINEGVEAYEIIPDTFGNNQVLFATSALDACDRTELRNMKGDYGIIPMPKWDEYQSDYYTYLSVLFDVYAIPKTVRNSDMASATLEALAIESYKYVAPAYYNKVLNGRYMSDPDSSEMLDIITTNVKLPSDWVFAFALDRMPLETFRYLLRDGKSTFSSYWRGNGKKYERALKTMLEDYKKLDD